MLVAMGSPGADAGRRERDVGSFDRRARRYDQDWRAEFHRIVVTRSAQVALSVAPDPASVLDIGCGTGSLLRMLAERLPGATSLVGVDPAPTMIEVGAGRLGDPRVRLAMAVAERLPLEDASFDLVVSTVSFDHWADQPAGLAEVARVLRPA
jgi:ubiquinone/menaquinone biosynthesis C-methylase UbiE